MEEQGYVCSFTTLSVLSEEQKVLGISDKKLEETILIFITRIRW